MTAGSAVDEGVAVAHRNEVLLVGRVSGDPDERELPSGDVLVAMRLVVRRGQSKPGKSSAAARPSVDTIDCTGWLAAPRRTMLGLRSGDTVEVTGAVRRRFWKAGTAPTSRYDVEVLKVRRLSRAQPST